MLCEAIILDNVMVGPGRLFFRWMGTGTAKAAALMVHQIVDIISNCPHNCWYLPKVARLFLLSTFRMTYDIDELWLIVQEINATDNERIAIKAGLFVCLRPHSQYRWQNYYRGHPSTYVRYVCCSPQECVQRPWNRPSSWPLPECPSTSHSVSHIDYTHDYDREKYMSSMQRWDSVSHNYSYQIDCTVTDSSLNARTINN